MRDVLFICMLITLSLVKTHAQTNVKINIVLNHVQNLTINPDQQTVNLNYNTLQDYRNGVQVTKDAHLSVFSTSPYEVNVKLANGKFIKLGGDIAESVYMPEIQITPTSTYENQNVQFSTSVLTTEGRKIISSHVPTITSVFNIQYSGPKGDSLIKYSEKNKIITFQNDVLYSIETK